MKDALTARGIRAVWQRWHGVVWYGSTGATGKQPVALSCPVV